MKLTQIQLHAVVSSLEQREAEARANENKLNGQDERKSLSLFNEYSKMSEDLKYALGVSNKRRCGSGWSLKDFEEFVLEEKERKVEKKKKYVSLADKAVIAAGRLKTFEQVLQYFNIEPSK